VRYALRTDRASDPGVRQLIAESHALQLVGGHLRTRIAEAMAAGALPPAAGSLLKLFGGTLLMRTTEIGMEVAGVDAVVWPAGDTGEARHLGQHYPNRQADSLGGGSNEIQRNIIAERLLGLPREWAADRDVAFRDVRRNAVHGHQGPGLVNE
jgi:alkylation response protein AidB-like acyl-CoA dehydrogenase